MATKNLKFNNINDLVSEIDAWIEVLETKKKHLLDKIDDNKDKFISYTTKINQSSFDLLKKKADELHTTVSSLIKEYYFMNFINNENYKRVYYDEFVKFNKVIKDKLEAKNDKPIGLALNQNDSKNLEDAAKKLEVAPRELIKFFTYEFVYDMAKNNDIRNKYIEEDNKVEYIYCKSSNVSAFGYDKTSKTLYVIFKGGRKYKYLNVAAKVFDDLKYADSKGEFVNKYLIGKYEYKKIN